MSIARFVLACAATITAATALCQARSFGLHSAASSDDITTEAVTSGLSGPTNSGTTAIASTQQSQEPATSTTAAVTPTTTTTTAPFVTGTVTAPAELYPAILLFTTAEPESFWPSFVLYLDTQEVAARAMAVAAAVGDTHNGHIFLGCVAQSAAYGCSVGFSSVAAADTALIAASNGDLASYGITGAEFVEYPTRRPSYAPSRSLLAAVVTLGVSTLTMLLA